MRGEIETTTDETEPNIGKLDNAEKLQMAAI